MAISSACHVTVSGGFCHGRVTTRRLWALRRGRGRYTLPLVTATLELLAIREIAHAFLVADHPADVYQFALDRVTPILGAAFSLVMQIGEDGQILHPVAQHEWPGRHRDWIGALRVRVGDGPSGVAVAERRVVEVPDLFADPSLEAWYPVADELGFRSIIAAPLIGAEGPVGAIAFYFSLPTPVSDEQRALVRLVADQLAATADKSSLIDALRRSNAALAEANRALEHDARVADAARRLHNRLLQRLTRQVHVALSSGDDALSWTAGQRVDAHTGLVPWNLLARGRLTAEVAHTIAEIETGTRQPAITDVDARAPLLLALHAWRTLCPTATITHGEPTVLLPTIRSDAQWVERLLFLLLGQVLVLQTGAQPIHLDIELGRGFVAHRVLWFGRPLPELVADVSALVDATDAPMTTVPLVPQTTALDLVLLVSLVRRLGGDIQRDAPSADGDEQGATVVFPVEDRVI